ncbi:hypothetical protein HYH03_005015 [Edaphochlamys debaryana]|uniref:Rhamnosyl O-methyltransferase n=1 Tax=Edaphochlamys debaryana TaxID=47281 RepID=A0A835Y620_9CHLO|nr:hypothetical protein HYH03_005015 [Edaphochlamys debaryana]|eukprot:KAG2497012.1 hypothetical protein HYH03_005015 [Edaphochlamys debaryana]
MGKLLQDPGYGPYIRKLTMVILRYTLRKDNDNIADQPPQHACPDEKIASLLKDSLLVPLQPSPYCANESAALAKFGVFPSPAMSLGDITRNVLRVQGWCGMNPHFQPYGKWLKTNRVMKRRGPQAVDDGIDRFMFDNPHKDRTVFLFDLLYEREEAFKNQWWLGSVAQQNPFDMYAIQDIIYQVRPDLIIETGTANGGSALLWASGLELLSAMGQGRPSPRVITIDITPPTQAHWSGKYSVERPISDPTKNPLWAKYVTFLHGSAINKPILDQVVDAVSKAQAVLVLLDSNHAEYHVLDECRAYCKFVTVGSYCIIQDTKLSRFHIDGGPTPALRTYMKGEGAALFTVDRAREPFYTHHPGGYLQRKAA